MDKAMADHEILALYIESFSRMFSHPSPKVARAASQAIRVFLNEKIVDHFAYEEQRVFPALLQADGKAEMSRLVSALCQEHKALLKESKRLNKLLLEENVTNSRHARLRKALLDFFHNLEKHSAKENKLIPSLL